MRLLKLLITALWLCLPATAWSYDLLIVQSQRSPAYDEVLRGMHSVARFSARIIVLTDSNETDLQRIVQEESPTVLVTLGDNALALARKIRQIPVIALMTLNFRAGPGGHPAMTGVEVQLPPERYVQVFAAIRAKKIGVISNTGRSSGYVRLARKIAAEQGIELLVREVSSSREVSAQLDSLAGRVDALWMLPDSITSSGEAADAHFHFSVNHKVPAVTFSSAYLSSGAAIAVEFDRFDVGKQAGGMAYFLMNGYELADIPPESPRKAVIKSNPTILRRLGIKADIATSRNPE